MARLTEALTTVHPSGRNDSVFAPALRALVASCALAAGCAGPVDPGPSLDGRDVRLTLLHTADWHSRLLPYNQRVSATDASLGLQQEKAPFGGAARMNWLIQRERAQADRVLHLDSGDCFQGAPIFNFFNGEAETRALNLTGVDAVVIGNHEFDKGALNLSRQFSRWATFQILASNYLFDDPTDPGSPELGRITRPYTIFNVRGLKVGVIGFGNLSSITSIYDQPNSTRITALRAVEVGQFYIDQLQKQKVDVIVGLSHMGVDDDQRMIEATSGFDVVLGGHLHIVLNPPLEATDCRPVDENGTHFIPMLSDATARLANCDSNTQCCNPNGVCQPTRTIPYWTLAPGYIKRPCFPRRVIMQHSGAFMKYLGRLDMVVSNDVARMPLTAPNGDTTQYEARHRYEILSDKFSLFPVDSSIPEEPNMKRMLEPYVRTLDTVANLDTLVGYSPTGISRTNDGGGDSPMGNLVTTSMWLRQGVQTDLALTNTLGIRDSIPSGPVSIDQVYNVFPFDNAITTMLLSGREVREMFDFVSRRSSGRGCNSQAQIAGARVVVRCNSCDRDGVPGVDLQTSGTVCTTAAECGTGGSCDATGHCLVPITACAETINVGLLRTSQVVNGVETPIPGVPPRCDNDTDCSAADVPPEKRSLCEPRAHRCMQPLALNASYSLAANDFIAAGGSGFFVLQRNTTQVNTGIQLRDAVIDRVSQGHPCGWTAATEQTYRATHMADAPHSDDGLTVCSVDADCANPEQACSCVPRVQYDTMTRMCNSTNSCPNNEGRCVLKACWDEITTLLKTDCPAINTSRDPDGVERCACSAYSRAGQTCRILSCFDASVGADSDGRLKMVSQ